MEKQIVIKRNYNNHIVYLKTCDYCQEEFWAKKIDGKCCSNACRSLIMVQKKKQLKGN